jgi:hypothetical protein
MRFAIAFALFAISLACPANYPNLQSSCLSNPNLDTGANFPDCAYPDLRAPIPSKIDITNQQGNNYLRFTGGAANAPADGLFGGGTFEIVGDLSSISEDVSFCNSVIDEDERDGEDVPACLRTVQTLHLAGEHGPDGYDACGSQITEAWSYYHAAHNHWHSTSIYQYAIHAAVLCEDGSGLCPGEEELARSNKVTFCLIDYVSLIGNNGNNGNGNGGENNGNDNINLQKVYWDCESQDSILGISVGFLDQYHHSLDGMDVEISNLPGIAELGPGQYKDYFIVSQANPDCHFIESDYTNNVGYVGIRIGMKGKGGNLNVEYIPGTESDTCCWDPRGQDPTLRNDALCGLGLSNH